MDMTFDINPGSRVTFEGKTFLIKSILDLNTVLGAEEGSSRVQQLRIQRLRPADEDEQTAKVREDLSLIPDKDWQVAQKRFKAIQPLLTTEKHYRSVSKIEAQAKSAKVHTVTIYRWLERYEAEGRVSALIPSKGGGKGKTRLDPDVETILTKAIEDYYLTKQRYPVRRVCFEIEKACKEVGLKAPHPMTVRNRIVALPAVEKARRRDGREAAEAFEPTPGEFPDADTALSVYQIDHTLLDVILVDDEYRLPIRRPWITLAIDVYSRMVAGCYISFDPPGAASVGLCLTHAILHKEIGLTELGIEGSWPIYGKPKKVHADTAPEFKGLMLEKACVEHDIGLDLRRVRVPRYGAHIERLLGTFLKEIHQLPGTTFSSPEERGEYDSDKMSALTLGEFQRWLMHFIVGVYHQREHSGIGMSPLQKYEEGVLGSPTSLGSGLPDPVADTERLRLDLTPFEARTVQSDGVRIDHVIYYSDILIRWINATDPVTPKYKRKFIFRRDPRNISQVYFYDPELKRYFAIPYANMTWPVVTLWEWRAALERTRHDKLPVDADTIFRTYERMREIEAEAVAKSKRARSKAQRRVNALNAPKPKVAGSVPGQTPKVNGDFGEDDDDDVLPPFEELIHGLTSRR